MIQIDMEMPERCSRCPFVNIIIQPPKVDICCQILKMHFDLDFVETHQRHPDCPLKEVQG